MLCLFPSFAVAPLLCQFPIKQFSPKRVNGVRLVLSLSWGFISPSPPLPPPPNCRAAEYMEGREGVALPFEGAGATYMTCSLLLIFLT